MTNSLSKAAAIAVALQCGLCLSTPVLAQSTSGTGRANVIDPLTLTKTSDFEFGSMVNTNPVPTQVELNWVDGNRYCQPGIICSGVHSFAEFDVTGSDAAYQITLPTSFFLTGPGTAMRFDPQTQLNRNIVGGTDHFRVGGWLTIPANQIDGAYTGSMTVIAEYQ